MMFNMKSISIAFSRHTNYGNICIINVFYQGVDEGEGLSALTSAQPCQCLYIGLGSVLFE